MSDTKQTNAYTEKELENIFQILKIWNEIEPNRIDLAKLFLSRSNITLIQLIDRSGRPPNHFFHLEDMANCLRLFGYVVEDVETKEYLQSIEEEHAMYARLNKS